MHGPPLTRPEIIVLLERQISQLTALGVGHDHAIAEVARRHRVDSAAVARLVTSSPSTVDQTSPLPA